MSAPNQALEEVLRSQLDEESFKRETLEFELNQHKEALSEMLKEIARRNQTIDTQNCLLGRAWSDSQNMASAQRRNEALINSLRIRIRETDPTKAPAGNMGTKRKFAT